MITRARIRRNLDKILVRIKKKKRKRARQFFLARIIAIRLPLDKRGATTIKEITPGEWRLQLLEGWFIFEMISAAGLNSRR